MQAQYLTYSCIGWWSKVYCRLANWLTIILIWNTFLLAWILAELSLVEWEELLSHRDDQKLPFCTYQVWNQLFLNNLAGGKFLIITSGPEGVTGHLEPDQEWCFHVRTACWSLKIASDPKLRLVEKTHTELVERCWANLRVFPGCPYTWPSGKTLGSFFRRSTSSVWVFSTRWDVWNYRISTSL